MRKLIVAGVAVLMLALLLPAEPWADAKDAQSRALDILQRLMKQGESARPWEAYSPGGGHEFDMLVEAMVRQQNFVCSRLLTFRPHGQFERGYFAKVTCRSDGPKEFIYRLDVSPNFERYSVRVWSPVLDD